MCAELSACWAVSGHGDEVICVVCECQRSCYADPVYADPVYAAVTVSLQPQPNLALGKLQVARVATISSPPVPPILPTYCTTVSRRTHRIPSYPVILAPDVTELPG
jgi:hypothetical protein